MDLEFPRKQTLTLGDNIFFITNPHGIVESSVSDVSMEHLNELISSRKYSAAGKN